MKIKLMHVQLLPILSGVQNMMVMLLSGLDKEKYEIYIVSRSDGPLVDKINELGWHHIPLDSLVRQFSYKDIISAFRLFQIFRKYSPDIVHTHSSKTGFLGRITARLARVPLIIHTVHGFPFHPYQNIFIQKFYKVLESFAAWFAHYNIFVNKYEREMAIHKLGFSSSKARTIYNGVRLSPLPNVGADSVRPVGVTLAVTRPVKTRYPLNDQVADDTLNIVSVSRFSRQKNIYFTIARAIEIVQKYENVHFTFYGDGELYSACEKLIFENQVEQRVILKGWHHSIIDELANYDVFLLNSLWEGLSISILEAMSVGLPIIASDIKGNNELVDNNNGWLIDPLSNDDLAKVVENILANRKVLKQKGLESIKKVTNQFSYELFVSEYERIYRQRDKL